MASKNASGSLVPFSLQPGRIEDFVKGMEESADQRSKAVLEGLGVAYGLQAWSVFNKHMRGK
jgi:hypothetical protein